MEDTRTPHVRLAFAFVLAAVGVGCSPAVMPLPMLAAGYSSPQSSDSSATAADQAPIAAGINAR